LELLCKENLRGETAIYYFKKYYTDGVPFYGIKKDNMLAQRSGEDGPKLKSYETL
jgi:hypothetical protein